ncbi:NUDIX domain-containing protein [Candidatus Uhrbacteria bacterium]|nr:NUDIX domain-containing protein [Candidatus Uhrbacteria bacterium]
MQRDSKKRMKMEFSAGGVVYMRTRRGPMIGFILDPYHKWTFAKGHIERGEKPIEAARRETEEEMGLSGLKVVAPLGTIDLWFYERYRHGKRVYGPRTLIHKLVYYFLMRAPQGMRAVPQRGERIHAVRWVGAREAPAILSYKNTRPILAQALRLIRGHTGAGGPSGTKTLQS